ncbi:MAG: MBL fold metallo-hydrolase, partial [Dictyoglomus turgidum]
MKKIVLILSALTLLVSVALALEITYYGHACVKVSFENNYSIIIDPFSSDYPIPQTNADLIISTHEHEDHFNPNFLHKKVEILVGTKNDGKDWNPINKEVKNIKIWSIPVYHDNSKGSQRGKNSIVVIEGDGFKIVHMGDIGHLLSEKELVKLKNVDILFIPVGGFFTLDVKDVITTIREIKPKIVIPIHYKTEYTKDWPILPISEFLKRAEKEFKIITINSNRITLTPKDLPKNT